MPRRLLASLLLTHTLCGRPVRAFVWPSAAVASLRASSRSAFSAAVSLQPRRLPGRLAILGAFPVTSSLSAVRQARALRVVADAADSGATSPDSTWTVVRTPGDGSCLFHAVEAAAAAVTDDPEAKRPAEALRAVAADAVDANADVEFNGASLRQWIEWETDLTPEQYAARMKVGKWGGQIELCLLARGLDTPIEVYNQLPARGTYELQHTFPPATTARGKQPIRLLYNGAHYDALIPPSCSAAAAPAATADGAPPFGGTLGQALTTAVLTKGFRYRFGQCVEGYPMPKEGDHSATVIWLHGLGDSGYGWAPVAEQLGMPWVKFLFPTAPVQRVVSAGFDLPLGRLPAPPAPPPPSCSLSAPAHPCFGPTLD
jgi:hypothetical protein